MSKKQKQEANAANASTAPETSEGKFVRLANARVTRAMATIRLVGNLHTYKSTPQQREAIDRALKNSVKEAMLRLEGQKQAEKLFDVTGGGN